MEFYERHSQNKLCEKCGNENTNSQLAQHTWCISCQIQGETNYSGNEKIDRFISSKQGNPIKETPNEGPIFEWIPYNQFIEVEEINKNDFITVYSAKWRDGPLYWDKDNGKYSRMTNVEVVLKCLNNSQNNIDQLINGVYEHEFINETELCTYGISQNPNTSEYFIIFNSEYFSEYCRSCDQECSKLDFIIPIPCHPSIRKDPLYYQYNEYSSESDTKVILKYLHDPQNDDQFLDEVEQHLIVPNEIYIHDNLAQEQEYEIAENIYGISQDENTKNYYMIFSDNYLEIICIICRKNYVGYYIKGGKCCRPCKTNYLKTNFMNWTSKNEKINNFIQKRQLKFPDDSIFEWISYNQFFEVKEINRSDFITAYSAKWRDGSLYWDEINGKYSRRSNMEVILKRLHNSQNNIDQFLNEVNEYPDNYYNIFKSYGISREPETNDYIIIVDNKYFEKFCIICGKEYSYNTKWCKFCQIKDLKENLTNWSENKKINEIVHEMQLKINESNDKIFEYIPFNQLNNIEKTNNSTIYTAIWENGPLHWENNKYIRQPFKKVSLKYSKNIMNEMYKFNKREIEHIRSAYGMNIYGISQTQFLNNYFLVLNDKYLELFCKLCGERYLNRYKWCKLCQLKELIRELNKRKSGNKKIDTMMLEMLLKIDSCYDTVFEWIPYNQFYDIEEIDKGGFATVYSAKWKKGPLLFDWSETKKYARPYPNITVALKRLYNSQSITNKFLNEVKEYSIGPHSDNILVIFGLSRIPNTGEYIIVLEYAKGGNFNNWVNNNYRIFTWPVKTKILNYISKGLKNIHQKQKVHRDLHTGNILLFANSINFGNYDQDHNDYDNFNHVLSISDMGLCGKVDDIDETNIYGVIPYIAPEVLRRKPYTQASDIYSFGMIMYFVATGVQPFANHAHDELLVLDICNGIRPEIHELYAPESYIGLMKKCWDPNPENRPNSSDLHESINRLWKFGDTFTFKHTERIGTERTEEEDIVKNIQVQFKIAELVREIKLPITENNQLATHAQAIYISREISSFTILLPSYDDNNKTECLDCQI
ncbi:kinase-like domain-containing protein [Rhizophagus clarus]|uniref:Kinase-like domain-containing protein n=1 Tax=Rhizophagus clarus TaxID=94130 RepID=A0A8H3LRN1_9GLOM|nr:kinase-like domain-containing protein [Rhizophagus clarus]